MPPSRLAIVGEARIGFEWLAMRSTLMHRPKERLGSGEPVLVVPGFATDDSWTRSLRRYLVSTGFEAVGWGLGRNHGRVPELIPEVAERTRALVEETGQTIRLVGWSLGGYLAREVAREHPELVDRVITLGTPVLGGPKYTASAPMYVRKGYDLDEIEQQVTERETTPITGPVHALYSRSDGIVAWRACIDHRNPNVSHHEVFSSHLGLVASPWVFRKVAKLLAGPVKAMAS
jgi:pimeloyl-ACP methyl ester carboxylesterase